MFIFFPLFYKARGKKDHDKDIKKKLLFPLLLLLKLKLKAILPIFVALVGIKALKALILSKLAITLVVGFIAYTLLKKPAAAPAAADPTTTPSSYDPSSWEPSPGGPYARVWDQSAQNLAYSAYYPGSSSGSSSSSSVVTSKPSSSYTI